MPTKQMDNHTAAERQEAWKSQEHKRQEKENKRLESEKRNEQLRQAAARFM